MTPQMFSFGSKSTNPLTTAATDVEADCPFTTSNTEQSNCFATPALEQKSLSTPNPSKSPITPSITQMSAFPASFSKSVFIRALS